MGSAGIDLSSLLPLAVLSLGVYAYFAACLMVLATKTGTPNAWLAWIPIASAFLLCAIARKPAWWFLLFIVPFVNLVVLVLVWRAIARVRGKPDWTAFLLLVPLVNLVIPAYYAIGSATALAPGEGTLAPAGPAPRRTTTAPSRVGSEAHRFMRPRTCPTCGAALVEGDAFCGECGGTVPAEAAAPEAGDAFCPSCGAPATASDTFCGACGGPLAAAEAETMEALAPGPAAAAAAPRKGAPVGAILGIGVLLIVLVMAVGAWVLFGPGSYRTPPRQKPSLPPSIAGTLSEFPVDGDPTNPAQPTAFTSQKLGPGTGYQPPANALPPYLDPASLVAGADAVSSATYRAGPQAPPVNVTVIEVPRDPRTAGAVAGRIQRATGGARSGIRARHRNGNVYPGYSIRTLELLIFVLLNPQSNRVIIVWAPEPSVFPVAERLAANVGNGERLVGDPAVRSTFGALPASLPGGLTLTEIRNFSPDNLGIDLAALEGVSRQAANPEVQQLLSRVRVLIPQNLTAARYQDSGGAHWSSLVGHYGTPRRGNMAWWVIRFTAGLAMKPVKVSGAEGLYVTQGGEGHLLFHKGPFLGVVGAPSGATMEQLTQFAGALQL